MTTQTTAVARALCFVLLDLDNSPGVAEALPSIQEAISEQLAEEVYDHWGRDAMVRVGTSVTDRAPGEIAVNIRATLADIAPGAEGFHQDTAGIADIEIAADTVDSMTQGSNALSVVISHEIIETIGDEGANQWADRGDGTTEAKELCDRVEDTTYAACNGVQVSNFLTSEAFVPGSEGPWDYLGVLKGQTDMTPGGYAIVASAVVDIQDVTGKAKAFERLQSKRKGHPYSRTWKRVHKGFGAGKLVAEVRKMMGRQLGR